MNMIKKYAKNKIMVTSLSLFLLLMFYFVPSKPEIEMEIIEENKNQIENIVYLLDEDNYLSQVITYVEKDDIQLLIEDKLNKLIKGEPTLEQFYSLIPKNTKINSVEIKENTVYIDFSKEILSINKYIEESMLESIVFSITEINGIDSIYISVDGETLKELPNSKKEINYPLTRKYGINKKYDLENFNNISKTTVYFLKEQNNYEYYVPVTKVSNTKAEKIDIIIQELKSIVNAQDELNSYVSNNVILENYNETNEKMDLVFNEYIFNDSNKQVILEEVQYMIASSIFENYDVNEVVFNTKNHRNIITIIKN